MVVVAFVLCPKLIVPIWLVRRLKDWQGIIFLTENGMS